jgi:hypothetical protein
MLGVEREIGAALPPGWSIVEVIDEPIDIDGIELKRAGMSARSASGQMITGAAAEIDADARHRAYFELLERVSLIDAMTIDVPLCVRSRDGAPRGSVAREDLFATSDEPERWQPSRSNGVALGPDWPSACRRAMLELVERDRLLRAWVGETRPVRADVEVPSLARISAYDWQVFRVSGDDAWTNTVEVAMIFGFPRRDDVPLVRGSAADDSLEGAVARAARECLQGLAFLWEEAIPTEAPSPSPTPVYHLDRFLWPGAHALLRRWLDGAHAGLARIEGRDRADPSVGFVDLTPPSLRGRFCAVQARCEAMQPLFFGEGPLWWRCGLPEALWTHPIA